MPPQQAYRLLDFIDEFFGFSAHGWMICPFAGG
jgi:hypothetical protein